MRDAQLGPASSVALGAFEASLADLVPRVRAQRIILSGGEPTLVPNLPEVIAIAARFHVPVSMCTNALLMTERLAGDLAAAGLAAGTVGLDGTDAVYARFRGSRGYARALAGMANLVRVGVAVSMNVTLHNELLAGARKLAAAVEHVELAGITVTSPMVQGRAARNPMAFSAVSEEATEKFANELAGYVSCPISVRIPRCSLATCPSGETVWSIDAHGRLAGCPDVGSKNVSDLVTA
jgi:MoaA/NifB/PqqE/SkfB family radical SAM enzyme